MVDTLHKIFYNALTLEPKKGSEFADVQYWRIPLRILGYSRMLDKQQIKQFLLDSCWAGKFVATNLFSWLTNARVYLPFLDHLAQKLDKASFVLFYLSCHSIKNQIFFPQLLDKAFRRIGNVHR